MPRPSDVRGECNAHLYLGEFSRDDEITIRCQLPAGHRGQHESKFRRDTSGEVVITWWRNERIEGL